MKEKEKWANDALRRTENTQIDMNSEMTNFESALFKTGWLEGFEFAKKLIFEYAVKSEEERLLEGAPSDEIEEIGEEEVEK